jgi:hypothetical protein
MREIHNLGPYAIRGRERAIEAGETLVKYGWLIPAKKHRRDMNKWEIVRKLVVGPNVATRCINVASE